MYCPKCGMEIDDDSVFCDNCGCKIALEHHTEAEELNQVIEKTSKALPKKKINVKNILIAIVGILAIVAVVIIVSSSLHHKCGKSIKWEYDKDTHTLTLSGTGNMFDYDYDNKAPWLKDDLYNEVEKIIVNEGIESLGNFAFHNLYCIKQLSLPSTLKSIGDNSLACNYCDFIPLPYGLESIGESAFEDGDCGCPGNICIPNSVKKISENVFEDSHDMNIYLVGTEVEWYKHNIEFYEDSDNKVFYVDENVYNFLNKLKKDEFNNVFSKLSNSKSFIEWQRYEGVPTDYMSQDSISMLRDLLISFGLPEKSINTNDKLKSALDFITKWKLQFN